MIHLPKGFSFSAVAAGIKASGRPDLALAEACAGTTAAAVFTKNRVVAAPLEVDRAALKATRGRVRAVIVNSGNANCATGPAGIKACHKFAGKRPAAGAQAAGNFSFVHGHHRRSSARGQNYGANCRNCCRPPRRPKKA